MPCAGELAQQAVDLLLGADVDAAGRVEAEDACGRRRRSSGRSSPSAGCRRRGAAPRAGRGCRSAAARWRRRRRRARGRRSIGPQLREAGAERQRDVLADRALHQEALGAVAGDEGDAGGDGVGGMGEARRAGRRPRCCRPAGRSAPERAAKSSSWPWPSSATTPTTSPSRSSKETSSSLVPTPRSRAARRGGAGGRRRVVRGGRGAGALDAGAEHQLDDPLLGAGGDVDDADGLAVAEHGGAVAEGGDLERSGAR